MAHFSRNILDQILRTIPLVCVGPHHECSSLKDSIRAGIVATGQFTQRGDLTFEDLQDNDIFFARLPVFGSEYHVVTGVVVGNMVDIVQRWGEEPAWSVQIPLVRVQEYFRRIQAFPAADPAGRAAILAELNRNQRNLFKPKYGFNNILKRLHENDKKTSYREGTEPIPIEELRNDAFTRLTGLLENPENLGIEIFRPNPLGQGGQGGSRNKTKRTLKSSGGLRRKKSKRTLKYRHRSSR